jgi:hypothetical protein
MLIQVSRGFQCLLEALLRSWLLLLLGFGLAANIYSDAHLHRVPIFAIFIALSGLVIAYRYSAKPSAETEAYWYKIGIGLLLLAVIASLGWVLCFDSVQISDFGVYFRCGTMPHTSLTEWVSICQSKYMHSNLIYWNRSLLYTFIAGKFAGANYLFFKIYNVVWHAATLILWFFGIRYYYGARVAAIATALLMVYPEWWFTLTLATTDNVALFFLIAFLLLVPQLGRIGSKGWVVLGVAGAMFCANQLRTLGPLLMLALIGWGIWSACKERALPVLLKVFFVLMVYIGIGLIVGHYSPTNITEPFIFLKSLSAVDFSSRQDFGSNYSWVEHFWFSMPKEVRGEVAAHKLLVEFVYNVSQLPVYLYHKAADLFSGVGYSYLAADPSAVFNADTFFTVPKSTVPFSFAMLQWFAAFEMVLLTLSCWFLLRNRLDSVVLTSLMWAAIFLLITLGLSEAQPRYSILIMPVLALLSALSLSPGATVMVSLRGNHQQSSISILKSILSGFAFFILAFLLTVFITHLLAAKLPEPLIQSKQDPEGVQLGQACNALPAKIEGSYNRLHIVPAVGSSCVSVSIPLPDSTSGVAFFVAGEKFPFMFESSVISPYSYQVASGQKVLLTDALGDKSVRWYHIALPDNLRAATNSLSFVLRSHSAVKGVEPFDIWFFKTTFQK